MIKIIEGESGRYDIEVSGTMFDILQEFSGIAQALSEKRSTKSLP